MNTIQTRPYPAAQRIMQGWEDRIRFDGGHDLEHGLYALKVGFNMELYVTRPPIRVDNVKWTAKGGNVATKEGKPRAYRLSRLAEESCQFCENIPIAVACDRSVCIRARHFTPGTYTEGCIAGGTINADAHEVWYVYSGSGTCETLLGSFPFQAGDYVYIPRLIPHTFYTQGYEEELFFVGIESAKPLLRPELPQEEIPYSPNDLVLPEPSNYSGVHVPHATLKLMRNGQEALVRYNETPFSSCVGWRGSYYPFALHTKDIRNPIIPNAHTNPNLFATFLSEDNDVAVSTFMPRWVHSLPYYHLNEWDECLFLAKPYEARKGLLGEGDMTYHPQGFFHGPHKEGLSSWTENASREVANSPWNEDLAVMFESRTPLQPTIEASCSLEIKDYYRSWM